MGEVNNRDIRAFSEQRFSGRFLGNVKQKILRMAMGDPLADERSESLVDGLVGMIRAPGIADPVSVIDAHDDPIPVASALNASVKKLYREYRDVPGMIAAGNLGLEYCLRKSAAESDQPKRKAVRNLGRIIAFNTAANCWPGWGDAGVIIEETHIKAGLELARQSRALVQELGLGPREQGTAHWLVGALEMAMGRFDGAMLTFKQAEAIFLTSKAASAHALMARGYSALVQKADPRSHAEGASLLRETLDRLRTEGSKEALFFADQLATADRVLLKQ
jgi:hypothetical protein